MSDQATAKATAKAADQTEPAAAAYIRHLPDCSPTGACSGLAQPSRADTGSSAVAAAAGP